MKTCIVLTGAGISADSGIKTFRDNDGLWENYSAQDVCTPDAFRRNPQLVIDFYNQRRSQLAEVEPNAAHYALVELESYYQVKIITQNVDNLHERAGSSSVLHLHGELTKLRSTVNEDYIIDWHTEQKLTDCDPAGFPLRPHIVWFGELVPELETAAALVSSADIVLVIGTSMQVYPAASLINYAPPQASLYLIDPHPNSSLTKLQIIAKKAKDGVPQLVQQLIQQANL